MQTREEKNTEVSLLNTPRRSRHDVEHVKRNTNADVGYLLWEARCLDGVAHLSKGLDASVQHAEFAVGPSAAQLASGVLMPGQGYDRQNSSGHNESGYPSIADVRADMAFRRSVPLPDSCTAANSMATSIASSAVARRAQRASASLEHFLQLLERFRILWAN
jgi:hypothetical protein